MGTYLENYLDSVSSLPSEVRRNFALLRELDTTAQEKVDKDTRSFLKTAKRSREESFEKEEEIKGDLKQALQLSDEKVALAVQTYELVDKHIRRLDSDLKKFEAELEQGGTPILKEKIERKVVVPSKANKGNGVGRKRAGKETAIPLSDARVFNVDIDMPIDPNEPTYCICGRVSFGEMVGCDNPDCKVEWFHFECVGLTNPPKGKWHCPECTALRRKQLRV